MFSLKNLARKGLKMHNASIYTIINHDQQQTKFLLMVQLKRTLTRATTTNKQRLCCHI